MADIFISYARVDQSKIQPIVALLESSGWQVWLDTRTNAGDQWDEVLDRELKAAKCVVVVWSSNSVRSRWVRAEASVAAERQVLVPVTIGEVDLPLVFKLIQTIDVTDWKGGADAAEAVALVTAVRAKLGSPLQSLRGSETVRPGSVRRKRVVDGPTQGGTKVPWRHIAFGLALLLLCVSIGLAIGHFYPKAYAHGDKIKDCPVCPPLVVIEGKTFTMGAVDKDAPQRTVDLHGKFAIGQYEITNTEYVAFLNASLRNGTFDASWVLTDRDKPGSPLIFGTGRFTIAPGYENHPVAGVSWRGAQAYAAWLSSETGKKYRLPSESEWEYSARAGTQSAFFFGEDAKKLCEYANIPDLSRQEKYPSWNAIICTDGYPDAAPVGRFAANGFGLFDTLGNLWEWVEDCWQDGYQDLPRDGTARIKGADCSQHIMRGGSFDEFPLLGAFARYRHAANDRMIAIGLRVIRDVTR